jgi:ribosomal protein S18 acetylase RimI-like enzyme
MIRATVPLDTPALLSLAEGTGAFKPLEIETLKDVLDDYYMTNQAYGHRSICDDEGGQLIGLAYYAPTVMTDQTWYLYWIAVSRPIQARGFGGNLLRQAEEDARGRGARLMMIETSSLPHYELTRRFYVKYGYEQAATLADFYADGDDMVVFCKRLRPVLPG